MKGITASVGHRGKNNSSDVRIIQELLIQKGFVIGQIEFIRDGGLGTCGPITILAIRMLQSTFLAKPDGIISPNGASLKRLNNYNGHYLNQSNIFYTLKIVRDFSSGKETLGTYEIPGTNISGHTLECPGPDSIISGQRLRIPEGRYNVKWHNANIPSVKPYNPVPLLYNTNVPESRWILFHHGNFVRNTDGCILVGSTRNKENTEIDGSITKLKALKSFLEKININSFFVKITSNYQKNKL